MTPSRSLEMRRDFLDRTRHIGQVGCAVRTQGFYIFCRPNRVMYNWPLACLKFKRKAHGFERQQQIGKDDGRIDAQFFSRGNGHFGGKFRLFADLHERVMLADVAILLHVSPSLAQEPDRRAIDWLAQAGPHKPCAFENGLLTGPIIFSSIHMG